MHIKVLDETYDVTKAVGEEYLDLIAQGIGDLTAAAIATSDVDLRARKAVPLQAVPLPDADPNVVIMAEAFKAIANREPQVVNITNPISVEPAQVHIAEGAVRVAPPQLRVERIEVTEARPPMKSVIDYEDGKVVGSHEEPV
jgi:hypothetical protein